MDVSTASTSSLLGLDEPICPYTGLRTFTEDEAIYFRGREAHVAKCLALLAEQRFVMITGASGDGKSSLVFAGMLPEVRAGFVRARYSSWAVATFRPERSPLRNLAEALTTALRLPSAGAVENELEHGFSALVQLYKTSALCPSPELPAGQTPAAQRQQQRQAANLLVVVDQFEEFFTNPENYADGQPNPAAQTVVNLLLETTRLAQAENLPIYIVCTMRSDFVGQCAEFRGLIEQVGASQYFVPRLLRPEFVEVIREPALLSGNRISERLVQRLLYDIGQGQDQLPVLQHALRRIWLAANYGREEMDLLHYAMVGGLADELPAADQAGFAAWRATLPAHQQEFLLASPSLRNVLDAHANQLYFEANERYNQDFQPPLPPGTAERVIEQTFRVLTRTDGKRVVRNRLTGAQITAILQDEALPWPVVCRILRPFREAGTTFLSPFLAEGEDDRAVLPPEAVLDLTHESLIRNWKRLSEWAVQEAYDVRVAENFTQQASRWQASDEDTGFLLPIGLYTFFAQWHRGKKGAASWLAYYLEAGSDPALREKQAAAQYDVLTRYLKASRRHLRFPLLVARYGARRLAGAALLLVLLLGLGWQAVLYRQQQSDYVAYRIVRDVVERPTVSLKGGTSVLKSPYVPVRDKASFLINADRLKHEMYRPWFGGRTAEQYAFPQMLNALAADTVAREDGLVPLPNDTLALEIELSMYASVDNMDYDSVERENPYIRPILQDLQTRLAAAMAVPRPVGPKDEWQDHQNKREQAWRQRQRCLAVLTARTVMALSYFLACDSLHRVAVLPDPDQHRAARIQFRQYRHQLLRKLRDYVREEIQATEPANELLTPIAFGFCLRVLLSQGRDSPAELAFLEEMSPFAPDSARTFRRLFPPTPEHNYRSGTSTQSGGYPTAALAFAALRKTDDVLRCLRVMRRQVARLTDPNSGIALLPYLVKYELLNPKNTRSLLDSCAAVGGFSFNEMYAATVYSLLSTKPVPAVFDLGQTIGDAKLGKQDGPSPEGADPWFLNADRASFALPVATRDKAWTALQGATKEIAEQEVIFIEREERDLANGVPEGYYDRRNELFLRAFLAKMHGVYLAEIKGQSLEATKSFEKFSLFLNRLQKHLGKNPAHKLTQAAKLNAPNLRQNLHQINTLQWNLGTPQRLPSVTGTTEASAGPMKPTTYLRLPTRPKTLTFETYYTCSFDSFFRYELGEATGPRPDTVLVQLLDSVAFVEAVFPDHLSSTRTNSLFAEGLARPTQCRPNLSWMRAIARDWPPGGNDRQERNRLLLEVSEALQDQRVLQDSVQVNHLLQSMRRIPAETKFKLPLQMAFSQLASALAHQGNLHKAFALADSFDKPIDEPMKTITKVRAGEQAMLANDQSGDKDNLLYSFLMDYYMETAGHVKFWFIGETHLGPPAPVAGSIIPLFYWMEYQDFSTWLFLHNSGNTLNNQLNPDERATATGPYAACKGYSLANESGKALEQIPTYEPDRLRQIDYNYILLSLAHLKTAQPGDGWREYDNTELTKPADYDGPVI